MPLQLTARFFGQGSRRTLRIDCEGRVISPRLISKARNGEQGRDYALRNLARQTGVDRAPHEDAAAYVARALEATRALRHPGNLVFGFALGDRRAPGSWPDGWRRPRTGCRGRRHEGMLSHRSTSAGGQG
ncbi:MAG TPA: hypothetical protein DD491_06870 [Halieaceae bacterium]|nr:hypothetical protein [Halieaceae bacterium]